MQEKIESCMIGLHAIMDAPQPSRQASFVQQLVQQIEQDSVVPKSQVHNVIMQLLCALFAWNVLRKRKCLLFV